MVAQAKKNSVKTKTKTQNAKTGSVRAKATPKTAPKKTTAKAEPEAKRSKIVPIVVGVAVAVIAIVALIMMAILNVKPKVYSLTIEGLQDVVCAEGAEREACTGMIELPANINASGVIPARTLEIMVDSDGTIDEGAKTIGALTLTETEYANVKTAQTLDGAKKMITLRDEDKIKVVYTVEVRYMLSDEDRAVVAKLDAAYQQELATEKAKKEQEERERAEKKAREKLAKTPFTYTSQVCGFQSDVYCLLLSDFVADDLWKERIQATFDDFISKTSNVTKSKHLIYIFQNRSCFNEKIESRGLSVCQIPRGQIAVSMDTQGITWSYESE